MFQFGKSTRYFHFHLLFLSWFLLFISNSHELEQDQSQTLLQLRAYLEFPSSLKIRNVLPEEGTLLCVACGRNDESVLHLFLHCELAIKVWLDLMRWLGGGFIIPPNLFIHWECWKEEGANKNIRKGRGLIWLATIWVLWNARNDKIFKGVNYGVESILDTIKVMSWRWTMAWMKTPVCLFYEWCWDPIECLRRKDRREVQLI